MNTLPSSRLALALRAQARGSYGTEAAVELLIGHGTWLRRNDFLNHLIEYAGDNDATVTNAWIAWGNVPAFLDRTGRSGSEARILRLACELWGYITHLPLAANLAQLDDTNAALVLDAITYILTLGGRR